MRPFDASIADLGTGGKDGKETRQQEAQTMKAEGPRVLGDKFTATLSASGPFKGVRLLAGDEAVTNGALVIRRI